MAREALNPFAGIVHKEDGAREAIIFGVVNKEDQAAAPVGAIMNQLQTSNLGADLYNGTLL